MMNGFYFPQPQGFYPQQNNAANNCNNNTNIAAPPALITGQQGPYAVPSTAQDSFKPYYRPGAAGYNAAYQQQQLSRQTPGWFNQQTAAPVQYTQSNNPNFWDAFGYANSTLGYYGDGKTQLNQQDLSEAFKANPYEAQQMLTALDMNNDQNVNELELAAYTLLSDAPTQRLWEMTQLQKQNPYHPNPQGLTQLENLLRQNITFDYNGQPQFDAATQQPDGKITPENTQLLKQATTLTPGLIKALLQQMANQINLQQSYQHYTGAMQGYNQSFQMPTVNNANGLYPSNNNNFGNLQLTPYGNQNNLQMPWGALSPLSQSSQFDMYMTWTLMVNLMSMLANQPHKPGRGRGPNWMNSTNTNYGNQMALWPATNNNTAAINSPTFNYSG
jgi:hypothetical protein